MVETLNDIVVRKTTTKRGALRYDKYIEHRLQKSSNFHRIL